MTFDEAREKANHYLERSNYHMDLFDRELRRAQPNEVITDLWEKQALMMRDYVLSLLCHVYAGLLKDPAYAMGYVEEVIASEGDDFTNPFEHRAPYRVDE
jgi:hypothetical protein